MKKSKQGRTRCQMLITALAFVCALTVLVTRSDVARAQQTDGVINESVASSGKSAWVPVSNTVTITTQPSSITVAVGNNATFKVVATSTSTSMQYQWQYKAPGSTKWNSSTQAGATTSTLSFTTNVNHNGYQYRCAITETGGTTKYSNAATLTIVPKITTQPADTEVKVGNTAVFTVVANGKATLQYQWQYMAPGTSEWKNSTQSGAKTAKLSVTTNVNHHGYQYRCVVTDGNGKISRSAAAKLTIAPKITAQPSNKTVEVGDTATFSVTANGKASLSYQWQYKAPGATAWSASTQSGAKTSKLSVATNINHNSYQYRCVLTDGNGKKSYSNAATLTIKPKITSQPASASVVPGTTVTFSVTAKGKATLKYQWQYLAPKATKWADSTQSGAKTSKLSVATTANHNGYRYRCVVTDGNNKQTISGTATLTVQPLINATDVTLYVVPTGYANVLTLPAGKAQSFRLIANGTNVRFSVKSGSSCTVDPASGLIEVRYVQTTVYNLTTHESRVENRPQFGDSVINCVIDGETITVNVHVVDYSVVYADELVAQYLRENITSGMTDFEKMQAIARYPASLNYSASYSGYVSMLIYGGGDCWASTSLIIRECEMLGIEAWSRNGNKDSGAGSGHRNAMAYYNGKYYELEAGYSGTAPRMYNVRVRDSLFSYRNLSDGTVSVYQYDGKSYPDRLVIPDTINGKTVSVIEDKAFMSFSGTEVVLPANCTRIGDYAFSGSKNLAKITLPATLQTVGKGIFTQASNVTIKIASGSSYLAVKDNCLYSKDMKILYAAPSVGGAITLPSTLTQIAEYAFYYNPNVTEITVPANVSAILEGAFGNCSSLSKITFAGSKLTKIEPFVFANTGSLTEITLPQSIRTFDERAFVYANPINVIITSTQAPNWEGTEVDNKFYQGVKFYVPVGSTGYDSERWAVRDVTFGSPQE